MEKKILFALYVLLGVQAVSLSAAVVMIFQLNELSSNTPLSESTPPATE
jgi:hypothetical protein